MELSFFRVLLLLKSILFITSLYQMDVDMMFDVFENSLWLVAMLDKRQVNWQIMKHLNSMLEWLCPNTKDQQLYFGTLWRLRSQKFKSSRFLEMIVISYRKSIMSSKMVTTNTASCWAVTFYTWNVWTPSFQHWWHAMGLDTSMFDLVLLNIQEGNVICWILVVNQIVVIVNVYPGLINPMVV